MLEIASIGLYIVFKERLTAKMHGFSRREKFLSSTKSKFSRPRRGPIGTGENLRLDKHNIQPNN